MPHATLTYTEEEGFDFRAAINGPRLMIVLWKLNEEMRGCVKYSGPPCIREDDEGASLYNETAVQATSHWRTRLWQLCDDYNIDLEDDS